MNSGHSLALCVIGGLALGLLPATAFADILVGDYGVWSRNVSVVADASCDSCHPDVHIAEPVAQTSPRLVADVYDFAASASSPSNGGMAMAQTELFFSVFNGTIRAAAVSNTQVSDPPLSTGMISHSQAYAEVGWNDTLEFRGPAGTPLTYKFEFRLHGDISATGSGGGDATASYNASFGAEETGFFASKGIGTCEGKLRMSSGTGANTGCLGPLVQSITVEDGDRWGMSSEFEMSTLAGSTGESAHASASVGFEQTVQLFITPLTEGATFIAASGATYSSSESASVPESSTLLLFTAGSLALLRKLRTP